MDLQHLVQCPVERGVVVAELLLEPLLRLSFDEVGRWGVGILPPLLQACCGSSARRRGPALSARRPSAAPTSPRATSAPGHELPRPRPRGLTQAR
jgi:hypothetical protein